jgi:hypothetical protein
VNSCARGAKEVLSFRLFSRRLSSASASSRVTLFLFIGLSFKVPGGFPEIPVPRLVVFFSIVVDSSVFLILGERSDLYIGSLVVVF